MCGAIGASNRAKVSIAVLGRTSCDVKKLTNSIKRLIAVLNRMRLEIVGDGRDRPRDDLGLFGRQVDRPGPRGSSRTTSASASTIIRQARPGSGRRPRPPSCSRA